MRETTEPPASLTRSDAAPEAIGDVPALVVVWSRHEPARVGEVLLIPRGGGAWTFGRDEACVATRALGLVRRTPGADEPTGRLACPRISRTQLRIEAAAGGALLVENVGRCPLLRAGSETARAEIAPGDTITLRNELVLLYVRAPRGLPALAPEHAAWIHPFGEPDAFGFVGESAELWELRRTIAALARKTAHVLVVGATGAGKELAARAIHACSPRRGGPFVARNAATIPESLMDAELFGHAKNFPNPGTPERPGLIGEAGGGTLFLDEIAEVPLAQQAHLLRVLDEGEYHRLGESRARRADVRLVAATNRPEGALKHDFLARFKARIQVPDLDARREDIPLLAAHLLRRHAADDPSLLSRLFPGGDPNAPPRIAPELVCALVEHRYTANLRELDAILLRATVESGGRYVELTPGVRSALARAPGPMPAPRAADTTLDFTPEELRRLAILRRHGFSASSCARDPAYGTSRQTADMHLRQLMSKALAKSGWDIRSAAAIMAGEDEAQRAKLRGRIETFLLNLRHRRDTEGSEALRRSLAEEWRSGAQAAIQLLDAIEESRIRGGSNT